MFVLDVLAYWLAACIARRTRLATQGPSRSASGTSPTRLPIPRSRH